MISLRDKIVNEGVLNSTKSGVEGLRKHVEEWIAENNIKKAIINPDCSITIGSSRLGENVITLQLAAFGKRLTNLKSLSRH